MYVIILEHPSCVTGNDVHTCVHCLEPSSCKPLCTYVHLFIYFCRNQVYQSLYTWKKCGGLFSYLMNFPADTLKNILYFSFMVNYTDLMLKIPLYLCQETNLYCVTSLSQGWGRGNIHLKWYLHLVESTAFRAYLKLHSQTAWDCNDFISNNILTCIPMRPHCLDFCRCKQIFLLCVLLCCVSCRVFEVFSRW